MMRLLIACICMSSSLAAKAQIISFAKDVYHAGEQVQANVTGNLQGIENDITRGSSSASNGLQKLGTPATPGFYRIDFKFAGNVTKSFLIGVIEPQDQTTGNYNIDISSTKPLAADPALFDKLFKYFKDEMNAATLKDVCQAGVVKFGKDNAIGLVENVSFCLTTISGVPAMAVICQSLTAANAKKLGLELTRAFLTDMKNKGYLNPQEYNRANQLLDASQIGSILKSNCSIVFKSLKALASDPDLKLAIGYFEQQCKTTVLIIEKVKIP